MLIARAGYAIHYAKNEKTYYLISSSFDRLLWFIADTVRRSNASAFGRCLVIRDCIYYSGSSYYGIRRRKEKMETDRSLLVLWHNRLVLYDTPRCCESRSKRPASGTLTRFIVYRINGLYCFTSADSKDLTREQNKGKHRITNQSRRRGIGPVAFCWGGCPRALFLSLGHE